jgi:hypothetical protein
MSLVSWIKSILTGAPDASAAEPLPRASDAKRVASGTGRPANPPGRRRTGSTTRRARGRAILTPRRRSWAAPDAAMTTRHSSPASSGTWSLRKRTRCHSFSTMGLAGFWCLPGELDGILQTRCQRTGLGLVGRAPQRTAPRTLRSPECWTDLLRPPLRCSSHFRRMAVSPGQAPEAHPAYPSDDESRFRAWPFTS